MNSGGAKVKVKGQSLEVKGHVLICGCQHEHVNSTLPFVVLGPSFFVLISTALHDVSSEKRRTKMTKIGRDRITSDRSADKPERAGENHGMFMMRCHDYQTSCRMEWLLPLVCV